MNNNKEQLQRDADLRNLRSSYEMYENAKKDTRNNMKSAIDPNTGKKKYKESDIEEKLSLMNEMQKDIEEKYLFLGGDISDLKDISATKTSSKSKSSKKENSTLNEPKNTEREIVVPVNKNIEHTTARAIYDVIPIPSKGECYKHKISKVPVSYLTAWDENLIVSPNLYRDGTFIDYLLKEKIMNDKIDPLHLLPGDRDAIILWLRATGYGNEFPVTATDDVTGEQFESIVDLSKIKFKEFNLVGDEDGYFDFKLPLSGDEIKFKFLTYNDEKILKMLEESETKSLKKEKLEEMRNALEEYLDNDDVIDKKLRIKLNESLNYIDSWIETIDDDEVMLYTRAITNRMEKSIVSVNNITDREYIKNYVTTMNVKDSSSLRKYIVQNQPGLDFEVEIEKPESLGGGSMKIFLTFDQFIFLNIT